MGDGRPWKRTSGHPVTTTPGPSREGVPLYPPRWGRGITEASPPRHSSHSSHSRNPMGKPIWLARGVVIVPNPVTPTLCRKVRDLAMTSGRRRCSGSLERYSENGYKEHEKGDDHEDRHRSQHGASAVRRGNTHVQGTCMPRLILRLLRPMWSTSGTGPPTCADVEGVLPGVVAPVRAAGGWVGAFIAGQGNSCWRSRPPLLFPYSSREQSAHSRHSRLMRGS